MGANEARLGRGQSPGHGLRRLLECLGAYQHPDIKQDRQNGDDRDQRHHERDHAEDRQDKDQQSRRGRVAGAPAHRLPSRMAGIDCIFEGLAHEAADKADGAIRRQNLRRRKTVARSRSGLTFCVC